ncbi:hypothetical protein NQT62_01640 [Limnobacter humi]|uniref:Uncharacterized protein n=1 Tax=Limnobacter humi TaxID=1778671 RepID=A0ABT1WC96_9BURK|nr:hypothetical protein [Limnobacter humi]MCQ8895138.1 hypothetical protein [Limnobacter humi]
MSELAQPCVGLAFGPSVVEAMDARHTITMLKAQYPQAGLVLLSSPGNKAWFELDTRVDAYIPLQGLQPRRPGQSRLGHWWASRAQLRKLQTLPLTVFCLQPSPVPSRSAAFLNALARRMGHVPLLRAGLEPQGGHTATPLLDAGAQALAQASRHYRTVDPTLRRRVVVLGMADDAPHLLQSRWQGSQTGAAPATHCTGIVLVEPGRSVGLLAQRLCRSLPGAVLALDWSSTLGMLAYADEVKAWSPDVTRICREMGRENRLLLA